MLMFSSASMVAFMLFFVFLCVLGNESIYLPISLPLLFPLYLRFSSLRGRETRVKILTGQELRAPLRGGVEIDRGPSLTI